MVTTRLTTADELLELDDGCRYELMNGELVPMPPANEEHATITVTLAIEVGSFIRRHNLGRAISGDPGLRIRHDPDLVLAPDFAFTRRERLTSEQPDRAFITIMPDFVVEILSPSERAGRVSAKIQTYLAAGVELVWIIDPEERTVAIYAASGTVQFLRQADTLDGGDLLPGFSLPVSELFRN